MDQSFGQNCGTIWEARLNLDISILSPGKIFGMLENMILKLYRKEQNGQVSMLLEGEKGLNFFPASIPTSGVPIVIVEIPKTDPHVTNDFERQGWTKEVDGPITRFTKPLEIHR